MAQGNSFSTQGATPQNSKITPIGNSPFSNALSNVQNPYGLKLANTAPKTNQFSFGIGGGITPQTKTANSTPAFSNIKTQQQPVQQQFKAPTNQAVKNQTVKSADGTVTTQSYHAPTVSSSSPTPTPVQPTPPPAPAFNQAVGGLLDTQKAPQAAASPYQGMLANKAVTATPEVSQATSGLLNTQQNLSPEVVKALSEYARFSNANPLMLSDVRNNPNVASEISVGRGRALGEILAGQQQALATQVQNALAGQGQQITAGTNAGQLANVQASQQITAAQNAAGNALEAQGQGITAGSNAGQLAQPQKYEGATQPYNPVEGTFGGGGANGALNRAEFAGNVESVKALTGQKNQLQSIFNGAKTNYELLVNTAAQGGVNQGDIPIINQISQNVQRGLASNQAVINFQNTLATVRSQYANILGGGIVTVDSQNRAEQAIPNDISLNALKSLGQQIEKEAVNRIGGIDQSINDIQGQGGGGGQTSGNIIRTKYGDITPDL